MGENSNVRLVLFRSGSWSLRTRGGRSFPRVLRRRCLTSIFLLSLLCLCYLSFIGPELPFHSLQQEKVHGKILLDEIMAKKSKFFDDSIVADKNASHDVYAADEGAVSQVSDISTFGMHSHDLNDPDNSNNTTLYWNKVESPKIRKGNSRKRHGPCEVAFAKLVDHLVVPESYMNFTQFSLDYIVQEKEQYSSNYMPKFGGHQTLEERENSYFAKNQTLHCGFVRPEGYPSTRFEVDEKDKEYMSHCRVVVSSCIFGSSDFLRRPASKLIGSYSKRNVCFMMFLDEVTLRKLFLDGHVLDGEGYIGLWKIVVVKTLPYADMRKTGKVPKFLSHRLFPSAWYSIWIDSKMRLQIDPLLILDYFLWRTKSEYAISNHYDRHCVWDEVAQNKRLNKYNHSAIDEQFLFYQSDGLVRFNESDSSAPLPSYVPEGSFIVRAHTPMSSLFSCLWFNEVDRFTSRDQLSFAYTYLKLRRTNPTAPFYLNMFKDCERRAMAKIFHHRMENLSSPVA